MEGITEKQHKERSKAMTYVPASWAHCICDMAGNNGSLVVGYFDWQQVCSQEWNIT